MRTARLGLLVQALFYVAAGVNHFRHRQFHVGIMPDRLLAPGHSRNSERSGGNLWRYRSVYPIHPALVGLDLSLLLIVFLDVHVFMIRHAERLSPSA